ncbi:EAL domain-containing protein [Alteriqipengyuania sp. 357]
MSAFLGAGLLFSLSRMVKQRGSVRRVSVLSVFGLAPHLLVGFGFANWMGHGGLPPVLAVASLLVIGSMATVFLGGRPFHMLFVKLGLWAPLAFGGVVSGDIMVGIAFAAGSLALVAIAYYQGYFNRRDAAEDEAQERLRNRSIDIMQDYEATGQGWFWETDANGRIAYISEEFARRYGFDHDELMGKIFTNVFEVDPEDCEAERTIKFHFTAQSPFHELPVKGEDRDGEGSVWWAVNGRPIFDKSGNYCGFRGSGTDLTERRRSAERASRLALFDSLTGLANRHSLSQMLSKLLTHPDARKRQCTILMLDLDRFKHVNDTFGHPTGDALLAQVGRRLEKVVGSLGTVGRIGGDEFQVVVPYRCEAVTIESLGRDIIHSLSQPYSIDGKRLVIGVSVGIALAPDHGGTSERVIRSADLALYAAKDAGRGRFRLFSDDLHVAARERNQLEEELRVAIDNGSLQLHYQPVVDTATEEISGFEALLRWKHPKQGWISPEKFIPVAEDAGLIAAIGEWAIQQACTDLARWPEKVRCAVNVSPLQFADPGLPAMVARTIARAGIEPSRLELEITESVFLNDDEGTDATFAALKKVGVRLALDDFGTGYSSLGYLKNAPFDKIKIDQGFVRGATAPGSRNGAIIAAISSLASALGMDTTAEGVETLDELELVRMHGCSHIQGYIYSKPLSTEEADELLSRGLSVDATGPRLSREPRKAMLRRVVLQHGEDFYNGTVRNISPKGAMIEGLWNVPIGTRFRIALSERLAVDSEVRWCIENRIGVQFDEALRHDQRGFLEGQVPNIDRNKRAESPSERRSA